MFQGKKSLKTGLASKDDLLSLDPEAAPQTKATTRGILLLSLISSSNVLDSVLIQLILSVNFSGQKKYHGLEHLGSPLTLREPRYWWSTNWLDRLLGLSWN